MNFLMIFRSKMHSEVYFTENLYFHLTFITKMNCSAVNCTLTFSFKFLSFV